MTTFWQQILALINNDRWLLFVLIVLIVAALASWVLSRAYRHYSKFEAKEKHSLMRVWLRALYQPLQVFIWVLAFCYIVQLSGVNPFGLHNQFMPIDLSKLEKLFSIAFILWVGLRFLNQFEKHLLLNNRDHKWVVDKTSLHAVMQLLHITIIIIASLMLMQTVGISITSLLAFGGISGIAVGFAAKDTLANFLGSMMIYIDRPFSVGDWIRSPDRDIEGTVEHIGWRLTRIRTFDKRPLYVPNAIFSTISVENPSRMTHRRIKQTIGLRYSDAHKVPAILSDIEAMLREHPEIDATQTLMVNFEVFAASSLNFFIYTFTKTTNWVKFQAVQQDVLLKALDIIEKHEAECAFPTQTLHLNKPPGD